MSKHPLRGYPQQEDALFPNGVRNVVLGLILFFLQGRQATHAAVLPVDPFCGPEVLTVADAWKNAWKEWAHLKELGTGNANLPNTSTITTSAAKLQAHLRFVQNRTRLPNLQIQSAISNQTQLLIQSMEKWDFAQAAQLAGPLNLFSNQMAAVGKLFPADALDPYSPMAMTVTGLHAPTVRVAIAEASLAANAESRVRFRLTTPSGKAIPPGGLIPHQGYLLHALLLDPQFEDYHHEHPLPTDQPGEYEFKFTPQRSGNYRLWVNLVSMPYALEEFPWEDLLSSRPQAELNPNAPSGEGLESWNGVSRVQLRWVGGAPRAGRKSGIEFEFRDPAGNSQANLGRIMDATGHLVGFCEDYRTLLHVHPDESKVQEAAAQQGPKLHFAITPPKAGRWKLYLQTQQEGGPRLASFVIEVANP